MRRVHRLARLVQQDRVEGRDGVGGRRKGLRQRGDARLGRAKRERGPQELVHALLRQEPHLGFAERPPSTLQNRPSGPQATPHNQIERDDCSQARFFGVAYDLNLCLRLLIRHCELKHRLAIGTIQRSNQNIWSQ